MSTPDLDPTETAEWHDALKAVQQHRGPARASHLLYAVVDQAKRDGLYVPRSLNTAYKNTIAPTPTRRSIFLRRPGARSASNLDATSPPPMRPD